MAGQHEPTDGKSTKERQSANAEKCLRARLLGHHSLPVEADDCDSLSVSGPSDDFNVMLACSQVILNSLNEPRRIRGVSIFPTQALQAFYHFLLSLPPQVLSLPVPESPSSTSHR